MKGSIQLYWIRFGTLLRSMEKTQGVLPKELIFLKALKGLRLSTIQRTSILTLLDSLRLSHEAKHLKTCSIRLLGTYKETSTSGKGDSDTFQSGSTAGEHFLNLDDDSDIFLVKKKRTSRNKPGMEQMAVRTSANRTNLPNSVYLGEGLVRFRCGKEDRVLKDCTVPFTPTLMYAPPKGKSKSKGGKGAFMSGECVPPIDGQPSETDLPMPIGDDSREETPPSIRHGRRNTRRGSRG